MSDNADAPRDLHVPADRADRRRAVRAAHPRAARRRRRIGGRCRRRDVDELMPFYKQGAAKTGGFEGGIRTALQAMLVEPALPLPRRRDAGDASTPGAHLPDQRRRSRVAAVVLPLGHDSRSRADRCRRGARSSSQPRGLRQAGAAHARRPAAEALATRFAAQWLRLQDLDKVEPDALAYPVLRRDRSPTRWSARPSCSSIISCAPTGRCSNC